MDFPVLADHQTKMKESEKNKNLNLDRAVRTDVKILQRVKNNEYLLLLGIYQVFRLQTDTTIISVRQKSKITVIR